MFLSNHVFILTVSYIHLAQSKCSCWCITVAFLVTARPCLRELRPNWTAHGSGTWVTENSTAENKTCCCNGWRWERKDVLARRYHSIAWAVFFFPPLLNKHQTAIRLVWQYHFLEFDNRWFPAVSPPCTKKKTNSQLSFQGNKTLQALNLKTSPDSRSSECLSACVYLHSRLYIRQWLGPRSRESLTFWYFRMWSNYINSCFKNSQGKLIFCKGSHLLKWSKCAEHSLIVMHQIQLCLDRNITALNLWLQLLYGPLQCLFVPSRSSR